MQQSQSYRVSHLKDYRQSSDCMYKGRYFYPCQQAKNSQICLFNIILHTLLFSVSGAVGGGMAGKALRMQIWGQWGEVFEGIAEEVGGMLRRWEVDAVAILLNNFSV